MLINVGKGFTSLPLIPLWHQTYTLDYTVFKLIEEMRKDSKLEKTSPGRLPLKCVTSVFLSADDSPLKEAKRLHANKAVKLSDEMLQHMAPGLSSLPVHPVVSPARHFDPLCMCRWWLSCGPCLGQNASLLTVAICDLGGRPENVSPISSTGHELCNPSERILLAFASGCW